MVFSSFEFILLFLPLVVCGFWLARQYFGDLTARLFLIAASSVFFGFFKPSNVIFIVVSGAFNFVVAKKIQEGTERYKSHWLVFGLCLNLLFLAAFKYLDFFTSLINQTLGAHLPMPGVPLLLGVSFFTIAQALLLVDCFQKSDRVGTIVEHFGFVLFFPYLISGPIERSANVRKQLEKQVRFSDVSNLVALGVFLFSIGLTKKLVFGDSFAGVSDAGYANLGRLSFIESWLASSAYLLHLYFDFSGYSDMAVGCALMLGVQIQQNFKSPLKSTSITDFWRRWHISLSNAITNYLFTPIVKRFSKVTLTASCIATVIAMTIAGLWHGPSLNYVLFGLMHGLALGLNQIWRKKTKSFKLPVAGALILTLVFVNLSFVVFRADSLNAALQMLSAMFGFNGFGFDLSVLAAQLKIGWGFFFKPLFVGLLIVCFGISSFDLAKRFELTRLSAVGCTLLLFYGLILLNSTVAKNFVYFGF
jgi:alginate O-acetyltransferase complex protein AlgI